MLLVQLRRRFLFPPHKADKSVAQLRREFAHVHDVQVKWSNAIQQQRQRQLKEQGEQHDRQSAEFGNGPVKEQGNMNRNGTFEAFHVVHERMTFCTLLYAPSVTAAHVWLHHYSSFHVLFFG